MTRITTREFELMTAMLTWKESRMVAAVAGGFDIERLIELMELCISRTRRQKQTLSSIKLMREYEARERKRRPYMPISEHYLMGY